MLPTRLQRTVQLTAGAPSGRAADYAGAAPYSERLLGEALQELR